jgi:ankyrin repeat protein
MNTDLDEILDLLIHHLREKSINIQENFDHVDEDNRTPLQLAISNNNLPATRYFLKYCNKNVYDTNNNTGDNLIHLAVRYSDLTMLKYLLNEGNLSEQGTQTNLKMTPIELARSIKRDDMVKYLNELYPQPEFDEDESSNED